MTLTTEQQVRKDEIDDHAPVDEVGSDPVDPEIALLKLDPADAEGLGVYPALWVLPDGRIAEATVNHPTYHSTFKALLLANR